VLLEAVKRMGRDPMTEKVDMDEKFRWTLDQVVWAMQRSDVAPEDPHKTFTELQMQNVQWSLDIANDGSGVNMLEIDQVHMVNRLQDPVFQGIKNMIPVEKVFINKKYYRAHRPIQPDPTVDQF